MKFKNLIFIFSFFFLVGCQQYSLNKSDKIVLKADKRYNNAGFTLIYNDSLGIKKLDNRSLQIFHKSLKTKSYVKITNPLKKSIHVLKIYTINFQDFLH